MDEQQIAFGTEQYPPEQRGRCRTCGFFGRRGFYAEWYEAIPELRESWYPVGPIGPDGQQAEVMPGCIVNAAPLGQEYDEAIQRFGGGAGVPKNRIGDVAREVIDLDRHCPKWFPYQPGMTPVQHLERYHTFQAEEQRRAHELRLAEMEVKSREASARIEADSLEIARATKATMDGLHELLTRADRFTTKWTKFAFGLALVGVLLVLLNYLLPHLGTDLIGRFFGASPVPLP